MRVSDFCVSKIEQAGAKTVFLVTGGGMMYLTDALACNENIEAVPCHHEQAVSMAAVSYAKYRGYGAGIVTTGCGGTNAITGVLHAYQDSVPCIFVSGQCATNEIMSSSKTKLRQLGMQEADIVSIVSPITKYAKTITNVDEACHEIEKAIAISKEGRPGPVWLDIPVDVQQAEIEPGEMRHYVDEGGKYFPKQEEID